MRERTLCLLLGTQASARSWSTWSVFAERTPHQGTSHHVLQKLEWLMKDGMDWDWDVGWSEWGCHLWKQGRGEGGWIGTTLPYLSCCPLNTLPFLSLASNGKQRMGQEGSSRSAAPGRGGSSSRANVPMQRVCRSHVHHVGSGHTACFQKCLHCPTYLRN